MHNLIDLHDPLGLLIPAVAYNLSGLYNLEVYSDERSFLMGLSSRLLAAASNIVRVAML